MAVNMSKRDEEALAAAGAAWNAANAAGDKAGMEKAHADAEAIRAGYGFSGGADGSEFIALPGTRVSNTYVPVDNSGNDYAEMVGMSDVHQAALEAAGKAWNAATTDEARDAAHAKAEAIRALYGYSGGGDGSEYIPLTKAPTVSLGGGFSYASAPTYTDKYTSQIEEILNGILNRDDFSYDALNDPLYQQYKAQYQREGQRAMKDTLGQMAARTGGLASSYATTAAQQANDYYVSQIADKIPELYQLAYSMYLDDIDLKVQDMGLLQDMSDTQYSRYRDTMSDWRDDRNFAYGMYRDDIADDKWATEFNYGLSRDQIADSRYDQEYSDSRSDLEYERNQITKAEAQDRVNAYLAAFGSVSDLDNSIITASGYTNAELMALEKYYADQKAKQTASGSTGGKSGSTGGNTAAGGKTWDDVGAWVAAYGDDAADNYIKEHYKDLGYSSQSAALAGWQNHQLANSVAGSANTGSEMPTFNDYSEAVSYMRQKGVPNSNASSAMTRSEWSRRKASYQTYGTGGTEVTEFDSYSEYLSWYVQYCVESFGG